MGMPDSSTAAGFIGLPAELIENLARVGGELPPPTIQDSVLADATVEQYRTAMRAVPRFAEALAALHTSLSTAGSGYAVIRLGAVDQELGSEAQFLHLVTAILTEVAFPFQPLQRYELWKPIGTKTDKAPGMSSGTGFQAHHIDLVNTTMPPDYTALLCVRPDPLGGGASIVSNARAAAARLAPSTRALLAAAEYRYGRFFELAGVGEEFSPFPILDGLPEEDGFVRFTGKMLSESGLDEAHARAAQELFGQLVAGQEAFTLQCGDLLLLNQHSCVHGREALGDGQHAVLPDDRRLLLQLFLRDISRAG
ncbi:TauD/TfdA family dioxygenase [Kitasatospora purpeofusca]|uniref:TauD/TfdA family dioxygenase n=1 Tax=Kitasatospora purpeofusca TaxID=67352 RepID=UPI0036BDFA6E